MYKDKKMEQLKIRVAQNNDYVAMLELGEMYKGLDYVLAEKYLKMAMQVNYYEGVMELGRLYTLYKKYNLAENCYKELAENGDADAQNYLGTVYKYQLKVDLAKKYYTLSMSQGNKKAIYNLGFLYYENGDYDLALNIWQNLNLEEEPEIARTVAAIYYTKKEYEKAEQVLKMIGDDPMAYYFLGDLYKMWENEELAEKYFVLAAERDDIDALKALYELYVKQYKFDLSEKCLKRLADLGDLKAIYDYADLVLRDDRFDEAISYYKILEKQKLDFYTFEDKEQRIKYNLCLAYLKTKNYDEAEKYLAAVDKENISEHFIKIAEIYEEYKMYDKAIKYYLLAENVLKYENITDYRDEVVLFTKVYTRLGIIYYYNLNDDEKALDYLLRVMHYAEDTELSYIIATIYERQNNLGLAKQYYSISNVDGSEEKVVAIEQKEKLLKNLK